MTHVFHLRLSPCNCRRIVELLVIFLGIAWIAPGTTRTHGQVPTPSPQDQADPNQVKPVTSPTPGDDPNKVDNKAAKDKQDDAQQSQKDPERGSWIFAPIPINSPAFGGGLILGAGYVFKFKEDDQSSPPSVIGAAAAFTSNGSRGVVAAAKLYFGENKYQTTIAAGKGRANYEFFGIGRRPGQPGVSVLIRQSGQFIFAEFMRNFGKQVFIGPRYQYRKLTARLGDRPTQGGFEIPAIDIESTTAAIGFHVQRDLRDSTFYPRKGSLIDLKADFFAKPLGSNRNYQTYSISYNGYHSISEREVIAYRGVACTVSDDTPFFDLCLYGARSDIRGYTAGEFQDHRMFATQVEYRRELPWRLGVVGFAGIGGIARNWGLLRFDELMPGAGVGLRFKLDKKNHINYRMDLGFGRGGHTLSFSVTEAF